MPPLNRALGLSALALTLGLLGCKDRSAEQLAKAQKEASGKLKIVQVFYDEPDFIKNLPNYKEPQRLQRYPGRLIETPLRPSTLSAKLPTPYLASIGHVWEPYANSFWDGASLGYDANTLAPIPATLIGFRRDVGNSVSIRIGGYSKTQRWLADRSKVEKRSYAPMVSESPSEIISSVATRRDHVIYSYGDGDLDGSPLTIECYMTCSTRLTMIEAGRSTTFEQSGSYGYGPDGTGIEVIFSEKLLPRWHDIRKDVLCFIKDTVSGIDRPRAYFPDRTACERVQRAIAEEMRPSPPAE